jgi:HNH endonuclease/NUMOD4 motif
MKRNFQSNNFRIKLWIPENLDIDEIIRANRTAYMSSKLKREKLLHVIDQLIKSRASSWRELQESDSKFAPVSSVLLDTVIHNYKDYLEFLMQAGVIESDHSYTVGKKCIGYCFTQEYAGKKLIPIEGTNYGLHKSIRKLGDERSKKLKKSIWGYSYLTDWWDTGNLRIDTKSAFEWIEKYKNEKMDGIPAKSSDRETQLSNIIDTCEDFKMQVRGINEGWLRYGFRGKGLVSIDIKNSQPYFSILLHQPAFWEAIRAKKYRIRGIKEIEGIDKVDTDDIIMLLKTSETQSYQGLQIQNFLRLVVEGKLYEYIQENFCQIFPDRFNSRENTKKEVMRIFYSDPRKENIPFYEPCKKFERHFPVTYQLFKAIKANDYTLLPVLLQRIESFIVIDTICKQINKNHPEIPLFTIHDSIVTTEDNKDVAEAIMREELKAFVGHEPTLAVEVLSPCKWKPVAGYEAFYEVSDSGEVHGIKRKVSTTKGPRTIAERKMATRVNNCGYTDIRLSSGGKTKTTFLHILLAKAFIPNPENKPEVNHKDGNKANNALSNLEWVTHSENMFHANKIGLYKKSQLVRK